MNKLPNKYIHFYKWLSSLVKFWTIAYIVCCIILFSLQTRLIFSPTPAIAKTPDAFKIPYEEVWLPVNGRSPKTAKTDKIHGWWLPTANPQPLGTLLYLHGKGFNIGTNINQSYRFRELGFSVLLMDYRGYGRSQGSFPSEARIYEDAETAYNYLVKQRQLSPSEIFLYGHSLGGAVAVELAVTHPKVAGLIVQSSFTSMLDMVERQSLMRLFPVRLLLTQKFDSLNKVKLLRIPVLFAHGSADPLIPAAMSEKLYAAAGEPKQILLVPNAKHNNGDAFFNSSEYRKTVVDFAEKSKIR
ncbi:MULTISPECIES: alpha/beta fold hydrolase [unclassified Microcoleus]|uniref:alpha/beta hydrolase n=1 Tax=unclassified Microcoleus TaxID=2642155 RepID=UPI001D8F38BD|nr:MULTISPECIES: alpha/beta fold hydrolase [unclassified Microcoleus]MCC3441013.1 alpha/beta hydrolase [Microcoleus sp. PH2017_03_ELD_O_A]MCC3507271.1 alpha/beta hydrolase [Microcoleus sp. PH2017_19_SFW_U_A]TAF86947.1 MAG: alpha/beta hydrolase [Oscillatoriales cyanobacterium]MCC3414274.1 alpha/beta hydrolase [Microcoleus sp. PH2017_02_FOX_O_A]MCC3450462.1 alpha/beta hydrolase [Microcoleus sp. PH2017_09_SFU_O_A]